MITQQNVSRRSGRSKQLSRSETGDTLVEILLAIAILGLTVTALLGALVTTITSASEHRSLASIDTAMRSYAEQLKYDVELQPNGNAWFTECAAVTSTDPSTYAGHTITPPANQPANYKVVVQGIRYWNDATPGFDMTCGANDQSGFQLVILQATAPNGVTSTMSVGLREP